MKINMRVETGVIAAGSGARMQSVTLGHPKELLPIINKPAVQLIAEEFIKAGLIHYGTTPGPIYFGIDYATQQKWRRGQPDPLSGNIASEQAERTRRQNRLRERHTETLPDRVGSLRYIGKYRAARLPLPNVPI